MRRATLYLDEFLEERDREQRKKSRRLIAAALLLALLGMGAAMRKADVITVERKVVQTVYQDRVVYRDVTVVERSQPIRPPIADATPSALPLARDFAALVPPEIVDPKTRHLCITPRWINFQSEGEETLTVSNPSAGEIAVTNIAFCSDRAKSGFEVRTDECRDRILRPGERCTIKVALRERIGETMSLLVATDAADQPEMMTAQAAEH